MQDAEPVRTIGDPAREATMPPGWRTAPLCLAPCACASPVHPGLHLERHGQQGFPACAWPKDHPESDGHLCLPADRNRFAICPECKRLVPKRAADRHAAACYGPGTSDPKVREQRERLAFAAYLEQRAKECGAWAPSQAWRDEERATLEANRASGFGHGFTFEQAGRCIEYVRPWATHASRGFASMAHQLRQHGRVALHGKFMASWIADWNRRLVLLRLEPLTNDFRALAKAAMQAKTEATA
ncbi:MAG: hypothetical protein LC623_05335 [Halobacteriales archaeon]|nr:hypothetical protein [Halobacteriales archaeon]